MNFTNIIYALLVGILPALFWLWFWLKEDNLHPEPRSLIASSFVMGMIMVIVAVFIEKYISEIISNTTTRYIAWATVEEIVKFVAVAIVALRSRFLDEPIDTMIYCITVALGFAALENALFVLSPINMGDITKTIVTGNMRFMGATLVHVVSSASIGFMIGFSFYKNTLIKTISIIIGILLAITLHASFNLSIIDTTAMNTLKVFGWVWISVIILIMLFEEVKIVKPKTT